MRKFMLSLGAAIWLVGLATSQTASMDLGAFPSMTVADGRSTVTISATLRTVDGKLVPDGTRVVFNTDRGSFRIPVVETRNGVARGILVAGTEAGFAKITASAISLRATATLDYEYVSDRSQLSSANEFIAIDSPNDLRYSMDLKTLEATGADRTAHLKYRDVEIEADMIQVSVPNYQVRAKNAILRLGRDEVKCAELFFQLNVRRGYGITGYRYRPSALQPYGQGFRIVEGEERDGYGIAEIVPGAVRKPFARVQPSLFAMQDLSESVSTVAAQSAIAFPRKEIQFQKADVFVGGARIVRLPLYKLSVFTNTPVITDQYLRLNDNQIAVDYPYYLDLSPTRSSLLRLSTGQGGGRGLVANRGIFLDFETEWNKGDEFQGGATLRGIGRSDWEIRTRQYWRFDPTSDLQVALDFPAHRSLYASANYGKQFSGFSFSFNASDSRSITKDKFHNQQVSVNLERDPVRVGKGLPLNISYGFTASSSKGESVGFTSGQTAAGFRSIVRMNPIYFGPSSSVSGSLSVSKLFGSNAPGGLATVGNLTWSQDIRSGGLALSYDYFADGYTESFVGKHQLSARASLYSGNVSMSGFAQRGLDLDRQTYQLDLGYRMARDWRLSYAYTFDRYLSDSFLDYNFVLGYKIGYREFGLTWSNRTNRFGLQVLGAGFN